MKSLGWALMQYDFYPYWTTIMYKQYTKHFIFSLKLKGIIFPYFTNDDQKIQVIYLMSCYEQLRSPQILYS